MSTTIGNRRNVKVMGKAPFDGEIRTSGLNAHEAIEALLHAGYSAIGNNPALVDRHTYTHCKSPHMASIWYRGAFPHRVVVEKSDYVCFVWSENRWVAIPTVVKDFCNKERE